VRRFPSWDVCGSRRRVYGTYATPKSSAGDGGIKKLCIGGSLDSSNLSAGFFFDAMVDGRVLG
jgi:hypothetical protein